MINLLPPQEKAALRKESLLQITSVLGALVWFILISWALVLSFITISLLSKAGYGRELLRMVETRFSASEERRLEEKLSVYKDMVSTVNRHQGGVDVARLIARVDEALPRGVRLSSFTYHSSEGRVSVAGFAGRRTDLLAFKNELEEEFQDVRFPSSVLARQSDIEFVINMSLSQ